MNKHDKDKDGVNKKKLNQQNEPPVTEKYKKIGDVKLSMPVEMLCNGCPMELASYLSYVRGLGFKEKPNYKYLRLLLFKMMIGGGCVVRLILNPKV